LTLTIDSDCSHWVVYNEPDHAVCVEPQSGPPDAVNLGLAAEVVPGRPFIRTMTLRWVLED
jgi:aldose 1-epimerase